MIIMHQLKCKKGSSKAKATLDASKLLSSGNGRKSIFAKAFNSFFSTVKMCALKYCLA